MKYNHIELLKKLASDLKGYSHSEIDDVLSGKAKFGIIDKTVEKIKEKINKLDVSDRTKFLNGELVPVISHQKKKSSKKQSKPDYAEVLEYLRVVETRKEAENYMMPNKSFTKAFLKELLKGSEVEYKSSDNRPELILKLVKGTVGSRLKRSAFIKDS